jgi:hypothetical protein
MHLPLGQPSRKKKQGCHQSFVEQRTNRKGLRCSSPLSLSKTCGMGSRKASLSHEVRTAAEPRQNRLETVRVSHIEDVNPMVRLIRLTLPPTVEEEQDEEVCTLHALLEFTP